MLVKKNMLVILQMQLSSLGRSFRYPYWVPPWLSSGSFRKCHDYFLTNPAQL